MKIIYANEVCRWLRIEFEQLEQLRRRCDGTKFPPPLLGAAGLRWYEADVIAWLDYLNDWRDRGATREALDMLTPPTYLAVEPELRVRDAAKREST